METSQGTEGDAAAIGMAVFVVGGRVAPIVVCRTAEGGKNEHGIDDQGIASVVTPEFKAYAATTSIRKAALHQHTLPFDVLIGQRFLLDHGARRVAQGQPIGLDAGRIDAFPCHQHLFRRHSCSQDHIVFQASAGGIEAQVHAGP
jgi:hypothetical protein